MLPYGIPDLDPNVQRHPFDSERSRCFVRGCTEWVRQARRGVPHVYCPDHGIRLHVSGNKPTYGYDHVERNCIVAHEELSQRIVRHPYKYDPSPDRLASENSEDMLSWNVFRSLAQAKLLSALVTKFFGIASTYEPDLYLWGIRINDGSFEGWHLLDRARHRFEQRLPVKRPQTEPDIALHAPGRYLILIEAKFTSPNTIYRPGIRKSATELTCEELLSIYHDTDNEILDIQAARRQPAIPSQLWRNMQFAEWMARYDHRETQAFHVNLVREVHESDTAETFQQLLRSDHHERFQRWTWEKLCCWFARLPGMEQCTQYLETKSSNLRPAFQLNSTTK